MNDQNKKIWKYLWNGYVAVTPVLAFLLLERLYHSLETGYSLQILFGNLIWFYGLMFFAAGLFCKLKYGVITVYVVAAAAGITNYFLLQFRNTVLTLGEFYSIGTAAQVIGNYEFRLPPGKIMLVLCFIILMIPAVIKKEERLPLKKCMIRWGHPSELQQHFLWVTFIWIIRSYFIFDMILFGFRTHIMPMDLRFPLFPMRRR